jgi:CRISPR-associated protein Cas2
MTAPKPQQPNPLARTFTVTGEGAASPAGPTQRWLLAHDISDPKRLQKVWRLMRKEGLPMQYSLYLLRGSRERVQRLLEQLTPLIDSKADDVRVYPLGENTRLWGLGTQFSEGGNILSDDIIYRLRSHKPNATVPTATQHTLDSGQAEKVAMHLGKSVPGKEKWD